MLAFSISDERLEVDIGHCLTNLIKLNEGECMYPLVAESRERFCEESRDLGEGPAPLLLFVDVLTS